VNAYLQIALTVVGILASGALQWTIAVFLYGRLNQKVDDQGREIKQLRDKDATQDERLNDHDRSIYHIKGQLGIPMGGE
jgi:hypothetical protein